MTVKIFTVAATTLLNMAVAVVILFALLLAFNGYSESDAMWGLRFRGYCDRYYVCLGRYRPRIGPTCVEAKL